MTDLQNGELQNDTQVADAATQQQAAEEPYDPASFYDEGQGEAQDEAADNADGGEQEGEGEESQPDPIDAPVSWAKDAKDVFDNLPREAQEIIATRERERETFLQSKSREAAQTRQAVETEARGAFQTLVQNYTQQLEQYQRMLPQPQEPDPSLLNSGDPSHLAIYMQQEAAYRHATAQRGHVAQQLREAQQHTAAIASQQQEAELEAEHQLLEEKLGTEWSDPSTRAKLLGDLTPIAAELGYSQEQISQARACDILAMKYVSGLKAKADKFDALQKAKMVPVRAAKAIPPTARAQAPNGSRAPASTDAVALLYPNDVRRN